MRQEIGAERKGDGKQFESYCSHAQRDGEKIGVICKPTLKHEINGP